MKRPTLRSLLLGAVLGTLALGFSGLALFVDRIERDSRISDVDAELIRAARVTLQVLGADPGQPPRATPGDQTTSNDVDPPTHLLLSSTGNLIEAAGAANPFDDETLSSFAGSDGTRSVDNPRYRVRVNMTPRGDVAVTALSLAEYDAAVGRFRVALAAGYGVTFALVAAMIWFVTGYLVRPVAQMAATANRIAEGHLDSEVPPPAGARETADLAVDLEEMIARLRAAIDEANDERRAMERFLADMAHEIRTPLTALKGYSDLYRNGMLEAPTDVDRAMSRIGSESERLTQLANAMLQLAAAGSEPWSTEPFDVADLVDEVASDLRAAFPDQPISVRDVGPYRPELIGNRAKIQQALLNLGANACHHNPERQHIEFEIHTGDRTATVAVIDHGEGIDEGDIDHIFRPFYRSDAARTRTGHHGAGLGLALAKQVADRHGGTLAAEPTQGGGATFRLTLPMP